MMRGDITFRIWPPMLSVSTQNGDVEINDTTGNVDVNLQKGDVKVTDTKGDVKVAGHGGEVEAVNATGSLTIDGEFYSSIRADKIAKGVRFVSQRTDLTLSQLGGHFEKSSGNMEIADAPGNLTSRTKNTSISLENVTGKIVFDNTNGSIELRFSALPKEDITINNDHGRRSPSAFHLRRISIFRRIAAPAILIRNLPAAVLTPPDPTAMSLISPANTARPVDQKSLSSLPTTRSKFEKPPNALLARLLANRGKFHLRTSSPSFTASTIAAAPAQSHPEERAQSFPAVPCLASSPPIRT